MDVGAGLLAINAYREQARSYLGQRPYLAYPVSGDADCIFGWGEVILPALLTPRTFSEKANGFDYRYYPPASVYVGITTSASEDQRHLYYLDTKAANGLVDLGKITDYLNAALAAACP